MRIVLVLFYFFSTGCQMLSYAFDSSSIYNIYAIAKDKRGFYSMAKDKLIKTKIQTKILKDENLSILDIGVDSFYGIVYIIGEYESEVQKQKLIDLAKQTSGVKNIIYHLVHKNEIINCDYADNLSLLGLVKTNLFANKKINATNIHVHTVACKVVLTGIVASKKEADLALWYAKYTKGSQGGISLLRILD